MTADRMDAAPRLAEDAADEKTRARFEESSCGNATKTLTGSTVAFRPFPREGR
jgi:hypothetical protein